VINGQEFGLFENAHWHTEGTQGKSLTIVCIPISIQTRNLSSLTVEHYRYAKLLIAEAVTDASLFAMYICTMCK